MYQIFRKTAVIIGLFFILSPKIIYADLHSAVGLWNIPDDKTGVILSQIEIHQDKTNGGLVGNVVTIFPVQGQSVDDRCVKCSGDLKNKPILGMTIISNMQADPNNKDAWTGGQILDPKSGNLYQAKMVLDEDGCVLRLRGYIKLPIFGRTAIWQRADEKNCSKTK